MEIKEELKFNAKKLIIFMLLSFFTKFVVIVIQSDEFGNAIDYLLEHSTLFVGVITDSILASLVWSVKVKFLD